LRKISHQLENFYKITLLEKKEFNSRKELAISLENYFLEKYFGSNKQIIEYAKQLILNGHKSAAKELNKAVSIFGTDVDSSTVINRINNKFFGGSCPENLSSFNHWRIEIAKMFMYDKNTQNACALIKQVGGNASKQFGIFGSKYKVIYRAKTYELSNSELITLSTVIAKDVLSGK
jgi:hypothetical protein